MILSSPRAFAFSLAILALSLSGQAGANEGISHLQLAQAAESDTGSAEGEVRKIDKSAQKITIRHGHISGLDMEAMTMVFRVKDPSMLDTTSVGEKVKFTVRRVGGAMVLESIEPMK